MNNKRSRYLPFLNLSAIIFSIISVYYTAEGFMIILGADSTIKEIFAWGFAVAISCVLLFCSLSVGQFISERKGILLSLVFVIFALVSLFFNINSIYGDFTSKDYIKDDIYKQSRALTSLEERAKFLIDSLYQVDYHKKVLDSLTLAAEREANDIFRPGKKIKWREIDVLIPGAKSNYNNALSKSKKVFTPLNEISNKFENKKMTALENPTEKSITEVNELYNDYATILNTIEPKNKHQYVKFTNNSGDPAYTLKLIGRALTFDKFVTKEEYSYIILSLIIGTIIDFPIFFALVLLRWPSKKTRDKRDNINIFSRSDNRRRSRKNRKSGIIKWD